MKVSNKSTIHRRMKCFVEFIAPEKDKQEEIREKSTAIRDCIRSRVSDDGYTIAATPYSGSYAKKTGLRRQLQGNDQVEGQDIDLGFILEDKDKAGNLLGCMVPIFEQYLKDRYPDSDVGQTKSSATIAFKSSKLQFDVVPLIKTGRENVQNLIRTNKEVRTSSVQKHVKFIKERNGLSNDIDGVVRFNDCLRLVKWWRYQRQTESQVFGNEPVHEKVPSFLLDLLCSKAFDQVSVRTSYPETIARWFSFLANAVRYRHEILFSDLIKKHEKREMAAWKVIDPMDDTNNVVKNWPASKINELAEWFEKSRDLMSQAIRHDREGNDNASLECLVELFGNSIKNQCKDA
jgi:hypothetical protein